MGRSIYFLLSNLSRPAGGHAVIVRQCAILRSVGIPSYLVFSDYHGPSFYRKSVVSEVITSAEAAFSNPDGVYVIPETDISVWATRIRRRLTAYSGSKTVIFNQNHFYTHNTGTDEFCREIFYRSAHVCTSLSIERYLKKYMGLINVKRIFLGVDTSLFRPLNKTLQIAYMPRKMPMESNFIQNTFRNFLPAYDSVGWVEIDQLPYEKVAEIFNKSAIFLSLQKNEGFGLPALEALAAGCLVVGFAGHGGGEYATTENGYWINDGDLLRVVDTLGQACDAFIGQPETSHRIAAAARNSALSFSMEDERSSAIEVWRNVISETSSGTW